MKHFYDENKDILKLMEERHSVRSYKSEKKIPHDKLITLQACIDECNAQSGLHIKMVTNDPEAFSGLKSRYGLIKGVTNYFIIAGPDMPRFEETCGYYGEELVLLVQQLKLRSCWVALTYSKGKAKKHIEKGDKIGLVIAFGYGETDGKSHKTRPIAQLANVSDSSPEWFKRGVQAAVFAPTAMNKQGFYLELLADGKTVDLRSTGGPYSKIDMGIIKHDFELAAGEDSFSWA